MVNIKGQINIQQMAFLLIAVMMFFGLIGLLFFSLKLSDLKESANLVREKKAMLLITKLANSPEFSCGYSFGESKTSCIDSDKIMGLKNLSSKYENFWGVSKIEVVKIFPLYDENTECDFLNYPNCKRITIFSEKDTGNIVSNFIALCRKEFYGKNIYNKCELAKIYISYDEVDDS